MIQRHVDTRPRLLAVLAHPDDESFGMGGTLAWYSSCGAETYLICATGGEVGEMDAEYLVGYRSTADRRLEELRGAAAKLGLSSVTMLGYRDSGMPGSADNQHPQSLVAAPLDVVTAQVAHAIRQLRPHVVVTFDPIGGYRHPDHIAIHRATVLAFHAAADPGLPDSLPPHQAQKLYYSTFSRSFLRLAVAGMRLTGRDPSRLGRNQDIDLASLAAESFPIHARIDVRSVAQRKAEAGACHASQGGGSQMNRGLAGLFFRLLGSEESFMLAYPPPPAQLRERDLFAGISL